MGLLLTFLWLRLCDHQVFYKIRKSDKKSHHRLAHTRTNHPLYCDCKIPCSQKELRDCYSGRAFVLCYFIRGGSILLYRTMQAGFQNIWLFIGLSLLHGVSNVLSKGTLNIRIKIWKSFVKFYNRSCCGPRLKVQPLISPRIRRFNADLEIQNILFEYSAVILSQTYLACYLIMSFDVPPWQVIKGSLIKIAISLAIDFVFNIISVFIQIHFYDVPMRKVWVKYWRRHVTANAFMIIIVSYFGVSLVSVFLGHKYILTEYKLRNCTSMF